jgi:hypothetical protein
MNKNWRYPIPPFALADEGVRFQVSGVRQGSPSPNRPATGKGVWLAEAELHWAEFALEGVEDQAEDFQGENAQ